jgi:hypothetical protein
MMRYNKVKSMMRNNMETSTTLKSVDNQRAPSFDVSETTKYIE